MKLRILVLPLLLSGVFIARALSQELGSEPASSGVHLANSNPIDQIGKYSSGSFRFLTSERGKQILHLSPHPAARGLLKLVGEEPSVAGDFGANRGAAALAGQLSGGSPGNCDEPSGTLFNLQPQTGDPAAAVNGTVLPLPQNEESVDFLLNRAGGGSSDLIVSAANDLRGISGGLGGSATGYYVHTNGSNCAAQFEGGLPAVVDPNDVTLYGIGDPVIAADPARDAFFAGDLHFGSDPNTFQLDTSVGIFRTTAAILTNPSICPPGTHNYSDTACWPRSKIINAQSITFGSNSNTALFNDKPHLAVDERHNGSGIGAGDVYVTNTVFDFAAGGIATLELVACTNSLSACSSPITISGLDGIAPAGITQFSHVAVRPDGRVTISYVFFDQTNFFNFSCFNSPLIPCNTVNFKWVTCIPAGAPNPPACSPPSLILTETQATGNFFSTGSLDGEAFGIAIYPKHDHQLEPDGTIQTFLVWDRCKVPLTPIGWPCQDVDVVMVASNNNGATWSPVTAINADAGHQFFPWVKTDRSNNTVNIVYYNSVHDEWHHRVQVYLNQIRPGTQFPSRVDSAHVVTTMPTDPSGDPYFLGTFFGDYIGVAARGTTITGPSRAYIGFTYNTNLGIYNGIAMPEQNNHLSRVDY